MKISQKLTGTSENIFEMSDQDFSEMVDKVLKTGEVFNITNNEWNSIEQLNIEDPP